MNIYLLQPINQDQPEWALSPVQCPVQVIADDEAQARHAAAEQLSALEKLGAEESRLHNPWMRVDRVKIQRVHIADDTLPLLEGYMPSGKRGRPSGTSLYVLTPLDLSAEEWGLSVHQEPVCVEARHGPHARAIAALHYDLSVSSRGGDGKLLIHPWWSPRLVRVEEVAEPPAGMPLISARDRKLRVLMRPKG